MRGYHEKEEQQQQQQVYAALQCGAAKAPPQCRTILAPQLRDSLDPAGVTYHLLLSASTSEDHALLHTRQV